jgi:hypothetical protein
MPNIPLTAPDVDDLVDKAYSDVRALPKYPYPSLGSVIVNHPGVLEHQILTDQEYQEKRKYDELMRRLEAIRTELPDQFRQKKFEFPNMQPIMGRDLEVGPQDITPYRKRGLLDEGMPIRNAIQVLQAPFSVVANTARAAYDLPRAAEEAPYVANKATGGLWNAVQGKDPNPSWSQEREFAGSIPFDHPLMMVTKGNPGAAHSLLVKSNERGSIEGPDYLKEDWDFPDSLGTDIAGYALEAAADPVTGAAQAMRHVGKAMKVLSPAARNAHAIRAAGLLGQEIALPSAWSGVSALNRMRNDGQVR